MEWYNIIAIIVGALGGTAGFIGVYKAKSEKTSVDIGNMQKMLEESYKIYNTMREEKESAMDDFANYKKEALEYADEMRDKFRELEKRLDVTREKVIKLERVVFQGYKCAFPPKSQDCPVLIEYEKMHCSDCIDGLIAED